MVHNQEMARIAISRLDCQLMPRPGGFWSIQLMSWATASAA
jgi:hypothetical protein